MHTNLPPALSPDEIDDLLYFTRANEAEDLQQTLTHLTQKHSCHARAVLEACVDPDTGNTAIHYCSANGFAHLLPTLLSQLNSGDPNRAADGKVVGSLLFNAQNAQGNTPLHWAAYNGHLEVVKLLVAAGADMWIKNAAGHLAMFEAERAEKGEVVQFLLEAGGREVERTGVEGQASAEDVVEVEESSTAGQASSDVVMDGRGPSG